MANEKIERVNADDITLAYNNNWYRILFTDLVNVQAARDRYALHPSVALFIPLEMLTPYVPELDAIDPRTGKPAYSDQVVYPDPPAMTDEIELEMRIRIMKKKITALNGLIFFDLRNQFDLFPAEYADLLTESLLP